MSFMKKWFLYAIVLSGLSVALVACSDKEETAPPEKTPELTPEIPKDEEIIVPTLEDEELFLEVANQLKQAGFTVGEPAEAAIDMFRAESGMILNINGDALLPLHIYKLDPSDKRLDMVDETGNLPVYLGSKTEKLPVRRIDNFIIHLHKGHPDYDEIMKVIDKI